ncbi:hypothetical protein D3C72_2261640 [compost metagenome]
MILVEVSRIVSMRLSTRRAVTPPAMTENRMMPSTPNRKLWMMMAEKPRRSTTSRPTTSRMPLLSSTERTTAKPGRVGSATGLSPFWGGGSTKGLARS